MSEGLYELKPQISVHIEQLISVDKQLLKEKGGNGVFFAFNGVEVNINTSLAEQEILKDYYDKFNELYNQQVSVVSHKK